MIKDKCPLCGRVKDLAYLVCKECQVVLLESARDATIYRPNPDCA